MLPDGNVVREVALGENGIAAAAKPGTIVVDMSSSQPLITRDTGAALALKKITLIDAPVSGGIAKARVGVHGARFSKWGSWVRGMPPRR
jgi:3-hydroxyisobutyrate dehydrogenase-like beta-hydroxyacid dehydrogenase